MMVISQLSLIIVYHPAHLLIIFFFQITGCFKILYHPIQFL